MTGARVTYTPRANTAPDGELGPLISIYLTAINRHEEQEKGSRPAAPNDAERRSSDGAKPILHE